MKALKIFLALAMLMAMANALTATTPGAEEGSFNGAGGGINNTTSDTPLADRRDLMTSLRGASRFVPRPAMKCNRYPRVCHAKGSPGPDCCKKKCVNVLKDGFNCGRCGKKCKYWQVCCKGQCVNVMSDKKHCGRCSNRCKKGSLCTFGMCSYA